jgi:hypothetical protein
VWAPALTLPDFGIGLLVSEQRLAIICEHLLSPFVLGRHRHERTAASRLGAVALALAKPCSSSGVLSVLEFSFLTSMPFIGLC